MKKLSTLKIVATLLLGIMLYSCGSSQQDDYVKIIPGDVSLLISADLASIYDKAGLDEAANDKYKEMLLEEASSELSESTMTLIKEVLSDASATGLDLDAPVYFFMDDPDETSFSMVAKMSDKEVFTTAIEQISTAEGVEAKIVENELFSFYSLEDDDAVIAFNENTLLFTTSSFGSESTMAIDNATRLFHLGKEYSITSSEAFDDMASKDGDIKLITKLSIIPDEYTSMLNTTAIKDIDLSKISYITSISFDDGEINFDISYYSEDPQASALIEKNMKVFDAMSGKVLKKIPAASLAVIACNIPGGAVWEEIENNEDLKRELDDTDEEILKIVKEFVLSLDGDFVLAPVSFNSYTDFSLLMYAEVNSKGAAALEAIYNNKDINSGGMIEKSGDNQYTIDAMVLKIYMGIKDGMFYLTNRYDESICKDVDPSASSRYADASGKTTFMAIDCAQVLKVCNSMRLLRRTPSELVELLEQLETIQASAQKDGSTNLKITLTSDDVNSLKFFFDYGVQFLNL